MESLALVVQQVALGVFSSGLWHYLAPMANTFAIYRLKPTVAKKRRVEMDLKYNKSKSETSFHLGFLIK